VSEAVKIANEITKWDGYALFDKDNVLLNDQLFLRLEGARKIASCYQDGEAIIWRVELDRKEKINDNHVK
jgi:uncharacterized membrane protein YqiK